jgi:curved DNA-binding protein CbpA
MTSPEYEVSEDEAPAPVPAPSAPPAPAPAPVPVPAPAHAHDNQSPGSHPVISDHNEDSDFEMSHDLDEIPIGEHAKRALQKEEQEQQARDTQDLRAHWMTLNQEQRLKYKEEQEKLRRQKEEARIEEESKKRAYYTRNQMRDAQEELGVRSIFPRNHIMTTAEIRKAYKDRMLIAHPDKGGSDEAFQRAKDAMDLLIQVKTYGLI